MVRQHDSGEGLLVDALALDVLAQQADEVVVGRLDVGR